VFRRHSRRIERTLQLGYVEPEYSDAEGERDGGEEE